MVNNMDDIIENLNNIKNAEQVSELKSCELSNTENDGNVEDRDIDNEQLLCKNENENENESESQSISADTMNDLSFIILRHVENEGQNLFWNECYDCIRKFYKYEKIYIIDDHSKYEPKRDSKLFNTSIINSEFPPNRAELLPYYYYYIKEFSKNTIIVHDTVFINSKIDPSLLTTKTYHFLWSAKHNWDPNERILEILKKMDNSQNLIKKFDNKQNWDVCFGAMAILNLDYIKKIFDNTNYFEILISEIKSRDDRMCFERISALLLTDTIKTKTLNGDVAKQRKLCSSWSSYIKKYNKKAKMYKIWVGRKGKIKNS